MAKTSSAKLHELVTAVQRSSKYRQVAPGLVRRIGAAELAKQPRLKEAVKATKRKLHQIGGAYFGKPIDYERALADLQAVQGQPAAFRAACRQVMGLHASTQERLPILDDFYATILEAVGPVTSVLDVACGLNPLALPWLKLPAGATYAAVDVYADMLAFLADFFALTTVNGRTLWRDVMGAWPAEPVDLALILKTLPVLAQVDETAVPRLLDAVQARHLVISFPVASLGGRRKGMVANYSEQFAQWAAGRPWRVTRLDFETELVFVAEAKQ